MKLKMRNSKQLCCFKNSQFHASPLLQIQPVHPWIHRIYSITKCSFVDATKCMTLKYY